MGSRRRAGLSVNLGLERFSGLYLAALFIVVFGIWQPSLFLTTATLHTVLDGQPTTLILGLAVLIPLVGGTFDLSVGATANMAAVLCAVLQTVHHWDMGTAIAFTMVASVAIGLFNGFLVVVLRINSFIATLGVATIIGAVQQIVSGETQPLAPTSSAWGELALRNVGGFQIAVVYGFVIAVLCWWLLDRSAAGRYLYAIGSNPEASRLSGVRVGKWVWLSLVLSALLSGIGGILFSSASGPSLTFGSTVLLPAFAAAFLGSTQLRPGRFNVWGSVIAVYVLAIGVTGLGLVTGVQWLNDMFNGVALVGAVGFAAWRQRDGERSRRIKQATDDTSKTNVSLRLDESAEETLLNAETEATTPPGAPSNGPGS